MPLQRAEGYVLVGVDDRPQESRHSRRRVPVAFLNPDTKRGAPGLMGQFREIVAASRGDRWPVGEIFRDRDVDRFPVLEADALLGRQETGGREVDADVQDTVQLLVVQIHRQRAVTGPGDGMQRLKGFLLAFRQRPVRYGAHPKVSGTETVAAAGPKTPVHRLAPGSADAGSGRWPGRRGPGRGRGPSVPARGAGSAGPARSRRVRRARREARRGPRGSGRGPPPGPVRAVRSAGRSASGLPPGRSGWPGSARADRRLGFHRVLAEPRLSGRGAPETFPRARIFAAEQLSPELVGMSHGPHRVVAVLPGVLGVHCLPGQPGRASQRRAAAST